MASLKNFFWFFFLVSVSYLHTEAAMDRFPSLINLTSLPTDHPLAQFGCPGQCKKCCLCSIFHTRPVCVICCPPEETSANSTAANTTTIHKP
ncbi:hypothetical protein CsSME_00037719 [Camellia sinensis var. sinensis]